MPREQVGDYPTDFAPMSQESVDKLASRGKQLPPAIAGRYLAGPGD